ncbi:Nitrogen permease regulator 2 [Aphelenchoides bicaudatus]|nr:Nitrogen permease regulator 2 [Aphelenchoides bicaudatus]
MGLLSTLKPYLFAIPTTHFMCILFGAPFFYDFAVTLLFSIWLSTLAVLPISYATNGSITQILTMFFEQKCPNKQHEYWLWSSYGSLLGAWFSAFVIPLDWDRYWQRWPIPCVIGSIVGFLLGIAFNWSKTQLKRVNLPRTTRNSRKQV